jgi:hypothetical protein
LTSPESPLEIILDVVVHAGALVVLNADWVGRDDR